MAGAAMRGRFGKERNLPGSATTRPGMRGACVTEAATCNRMCATRKADPRGRRYLMSK